MNNTDLMNYKIGDLIMVRWEMNIRRSIGWCKIIEANFNDPDKTFNLQNVDIDIPYFEGWVPNKDYYIASDVLDFPKIEPGMFGRDVGFSIVQCYVKTRIPQTLYWRYIDGTEEYPVDDDFASILDEVYDFNEQTGQKIEIWNRETARTRRHLSKRAERLAFDIETLNHQIQALKL